MENSPILNYSSTLLSQDIVVVPENTLNSIRINSTKSSNKLLQEYQLEAFKLRCTRPEKYVDFKENTSEVLFEAFSPNGIFIASGSNDNKIMIWNVQKREIVYTSEEQQGSIMSLEFSKDSRYLASSNSLKFIDLWDMNAKTIRPINFHHLNSEISLIGFTYDNDYIFGVLSNCEIKVWNIQNSDEVHLEYKIQSNTITCVEFSRDNSYFVFGSSDGSINLKNFKGNQEEYSLILKNKGVLSVRLSINGDYILIAFSDSIVKMHRLSKKKMEFALNLDKDRVIIAKFSENLKYIGYGLHSGLIKIFDYQEKKIFMLETNNNSKIRSLSFSADGKYIVSGHINIVRLWNIEENQELTFSGHQKKVQLAKVSSDHKTILSVSNTGDIITWDLNNKAQKTTFYIRNSETESVALSDDDKSVALGLKDGKILILDLEGNMEASLVAIHSPVLSLGFSNDKNYIACGYGKINKNLQIINIHDKKKLKLKDI